MKILYGVQGTGNGHISRARMMAKEFALLKNPSIELTFLFSGRDKNEFFDMECFGDYLYRRGLSFETIDGKISYFNTMINNNFLTILKDVITLDVEQYDIIITDFEPITAWAGKLRNKTVIGIGHQSAFNYDIPKVSGSPLINLIMRYFSPATISFGMHWHHFGNNILPPIIDNTVHRQQQNDNQYILIYLPFEDQDKVTKLLNDFKEFHFIQYAPSITNQMYHNVTRKKTCHHGFKKDLSAANAVFCNAGFELISECLALQIPVLTKPVKGQFEQECNAKALQKLGYATTIDSLNQQHIEQWLQGEKAVTKINYPNVAKALVEMIVHQYPVNNELSSHLTQELWKQTQITIADLGSGHVC